MTPRPIRTACPGPASRRRAAAWLLGAASVLLSAAVAAQSAATTPTGGRPDLAARVHALKSRSDVDYVDLAVTRSDMACTHTRYSDPVPRMQAASISKLFTATLVLLLEAEGRLALDDPLGDHLPAFRDSGIRLEHLLTHRSGLEDRVRPAERRSDAEVAAYIDAVARRRRPAAPGARWHYADANFDLLGRVVARADGRTFMESARVRLLEPLGMLDSTFDLREVPEAARVAGSRRLLGLRRTLPARWDRATAPSSGLQTTATDLARFVRAVLLASEGMEDGVIPPAVIERMTRPRGETDRPGVTQGLGWVRVATPSGPRWQHAGGQRGQESLLTVYPHEHFGVVVMGNARDWPRFELEQELAAAVRSGEVCRPWR